MNDIIEDPVLNVASEAVNTAWQRPSYDNNTEMPDFFRSLSQRFRSQSTRQPRNNVNNVKDNKQSSSQPPKFDNRRECLCKVLLLDGTDINVIVSVS